MADLIFKLINLAKEFSQKHTVSIYELLQKTSYLKVADQISEQDLYKGLAIHPDFISDWLEYSEDKRTDDGWYFKLSDRNKYLVGSVNESGITETEYNDKIEACAVFVKKELDLIACAMHSKGNMHIKGNSPG